MIQIIQHQGLAKKLIRFPREDSCRCDKPTRIIAVADGVTRDCRNGRSAVKHGFKDFLKSSVESFRDAWKIFWHYPRNPDPAQEVADGFTNSFVERLKNVHPPQRDEAALKNVMRQINKANIRTKNIRLCLTSETVDYLANDYAGCVGAGASLGTREGQDILSWGFIGDSGVFVVRDINREADLVLKTPDEGPNYGERHEYLEGIVQELGGWRNADARRAIRRDYRNHPEKGLEHTFGVLTGEASKNILPYVKTGEIKVRPGDVVGVYTDGANVLFKEPRGREGKNEMEIKGEVIDLLRQKDYKALERLFKSEGTLVLEEV